MSRFENWEGVDKMITIVIEQGRMNDLYPPDKFVQEKDLNSHLVELWFY